MKTFEVFQLLRQIWGILSNADVFHYGWDLSVHLNLIDWKIHFSELRGLLEYFNIYLDFLDFLQHFGVFQLLGQIWGFLNNVCMFCYGWGLLVLAFVLLFLYS